MELSRDEAREMRDNQERQLTQLVNLFRERTGEGDLLVLNEALRLWAADSVTMLPEDRDSVDMMRSAMERAIEGGHAETAAHCKDVILDGSEGGHEAAKDLILAGGAA